MPSAGLVLAWTPDGGDEPVRPQSKIGASLRGSDTEPASLDARGQKLQRPVVRRRHGVVERDEFRALEKAERQTAAGAQASRELGQRGIDELWFGVNEGVPRENAAEAFGGEVELLGPPDPKADAGIPALCGVDELDVKAELHHVPKSNHRYRERETRSQFAHGLAEPRPYAGQPCSGHRSVGRQSLTPTDISLSESRDGSICGAVQQILECQPARRGSRRCAFCHPIAARDSVER